MRGIRFYYTTMIIAAVAMLLTGCDGEESLSPAGGNLSFNLMTRSSGDDSELRQLTDEQAVRLFVVNRPQEHAASGEKEVLHLSQTVDLTDGAYQLSGLLGQWYKFAFVCVPDLNDNMGSAMFEAKSGTYEMEHDFNKLLVDYGPILDYQELGPTAKNEDDLAVYRKIIDRWVDAVNPTSEDVVLTRITGQLILDMGKPTDQFPYQVESIVLTMKTAERFYIHDQAEDALIMESGTESERTRTFTTYLNGEDQKVEQVIRVSLLPGTLKGAKVTVNFVDEKNPASKEYSLADEEATPITIKKNVRTTVLFNGMHPDEFEVRYAGFDDGNDAVIDVSGGDKDEWNGVN